ncbi:hypothetical protein ISCGN_032163 [Ixodes scapularis]
MTPKPGKKLQIENLRPISLTSCVGKLMEHVVLTRLNNHMENRGLAAGLKAILALDLTKAFDNVTHKAVLENLRDLGVGRKAYTYVRDFLSNRTTKLSIGDIKSEEIELGSRGTPEGSVLSPFLFNVAMIGLPKILDKIKGLNHSLYADDVTLWIENVRPISLTSCVGKLMEHVVLTRLNNHMENRGLYPHTMIGFRPHLSTQDVMLQIKHQRLDARGRAAGLKAILGLDLTKAFDNVTRKAVLENLRDLRPKKPPRSRRSRPSSSTAVDETAAPVTPLTVLGH